MCLFTAVMAPCFPAVFTPKRLVMAVGSFQKAGSFIALGESSLSDEVIQWGDQRQQKPCGCAILILTYGKDCSQRNRNCDRALKLCTEFSPNLVQIYFLNPEYLVLQELQGFDYLRVPQIRHLQRFEQGIIGSQGKGTLGGRTIALISQQQKGNLGHFRVVLQALEDG